MSWDRIHRQEAILREKIAVIILDRLNDPRLGFVTVTGVKLSKDKRYCKVKFTVLGTETERRTTERALKDAAPRVQELLAPTYKARILPEIQFEYDGAIEKESRLLTLIESLGVEGDADDDPLGAPEPGADEPDVDAEDAPARPSRSDEPERGPGA